MVAYFKVFCYFFNLDLSADILLNFQSGVFPAKVTRHFVLFPRRRSKSQQENHKCVRLQRIMVCICDCRYYRYVSGERQIQWNNDDSILLNLYLLMHLMSSLSVCYYYISHRRRGISRRLFIVSIDLKSSVCEVVHTDGTSRCWVWSIGITN